MSRLSVVSALLDALDDLALGVDDLGDWEGEARAFNPDAHGSAVYVELAGVAFSEDLEQGAATYERTYTLHVYALAEGTAAALPLLDALEAGLTQLDLDAGDETVRLWPAGETHDAVILGRHCYRQTYQATRLVSR